MDDLTVFLFFFFFKFSQIWTHFKSSSDKSNWFYNSFAIFVKWYPLLRIFLTKMELILRIFGGKVSHLGSTFPYASTYEYSALIGGVANWKCHQRLDEILIFLPALHRRNQQSCFRKNSVMQYACKTLRNVVCTAYACCNVRVSHSISLL